MVSEALEFTQNEDCIRGTARLVLRRPRAADAAGIAALANDRMIAENTASIPYPYTLADAQRLIERAQSPGAGHLAAFIDSDSAETLIGMGGIGGGEAGVPELGYWIGAPFRGRGYATEVARAVVDHAFEDLGVERVAAACRVTNAASRSVLEKCGFQWAGCGLASSVGFRGAFPVDRFRLDRRIWESIIAWGSGRSARWPVAALSDRASA